MKIGKEVIKNPKQALTIAFDQELKTAMVYPSSEPYKPFNEVWQAWDGKRLYRGSEEIIKMVVIENLNRIAKENGFRYFRVDRCDDYVVQIIAFFKGFVPIQIWKAGSEYFTCGDNEFVASKELMKNPLLKMETTEEYETDQKRKIEALKRKGIKLYCDSCKKNLTFESCSSVSIKNNYVIFTCPTCQVPHQNKIDKKEELPI